MGLGTVAVSVTGSVARPDVAITVQVSVLGTSIRVSV